MPANRRSGYLFLSLLQAKTGASLITRLGDAPPDALFRGSPSELAARFRMTERAVEAMENLRASFDEEVIYARLRERGIGVATLADDGYPARLREIPDPPPALLVRGTLQLTPLPWPSWVLEGPPPGGVEAASALGRALGERGVCVVSGLALGIDAAAHQGTLEVGGPTVGVLGCGIDVVYPKEHARLFEGVMGAGALVSEYFPGEPPLAWRFPARNRIIAGLCDAAVVVEAPSRSGALITARHAAECGRDVWAVPGSLGSARCAGSNKLLADGAGVVWDIDEFVDAYANEARASNRGEPAADRAAVPASLPAGEAQVLASVGFAPTEVDVISTRSGLETRKALSALSLLEIKGYVARGSGGTFTRRPAL